MARRAAERRRWALTALQERFNVVEEEVTTATENMVFKLPRELAD